MHGDVGQIQMEFGTQMTEMDEGSYRWYKDLRTYDAKCRSTKYEHMNSTL